MQIHMKKLVEVTKDIDGFKELQRFPNTYISRIGECDNGRDGRVQRKGVLQATYHRNG